VWQFSDRDPAAIGREGERLIARVAPVSAPGRFMLPRIERLTNGEVAVLRCAARGLTTRETALELGSADETVKGQRASLCRKLVANNITHAVALFYGLGV
jgi:DNA-binding CsgD family transcriptional regulator